MYNKTNKANQKIDEKPHTNVSNYTTLNHCCYYYYYYYYLISNKFKIMWITLKFIMGMKPGR
jgi:hypothetical protein